MGNIEVKVPQVGESITEASIVEWFCNEGDLVQNGDILVALETDKVTLELPAPSSGKVSVIKNKVGDTVKIDDVILILEGSGASPTVTEDKTDTDTHEKQESKDASTADPEPSLPADLSGRNLDLAPAARRLVDEHKIDILQLYANREGSGRRGQITKGDILEFLDKEKEKSQNNTNPAPSPAMPSPNTSAEREEIVPMSRLRIRVAERLTQVQQEAALLTTFNEVDMTEVMSLRSRHKKDFSEKHGVNLGFMSFFAKAVVHALQSVPAINTEIRGTDIVYKKYYDIGIAVGGPKGLVVPVIRNVDKLSFSEIESSILDYVKKIQSNTIELADLSGGTFTISNGGVYGSMLSTPILNAPQSGILGMHNIVRRPVVVGDEIVIRPIMYLALSYDHRVVDGQGAVTFLVEVKKAIENPERLLLNL